MSIDDLGVIAEVIVCQSFVDKFEANDTQRSVKQFFPHEPRILTELTAAWSSQCSPRARSSAQDSLDRLATISAEKRLSHLAVCSSAWEEDFKLVRRLWAIFIADVSLPD